MLQLAFHEHLRAFLNSSYIGRFSGLSEEHAIVPLSD
jgi:hypothetical protein